MNQYHFFDESIRLSQFFMEQFYMRTLKDILPLLHPHVVWIGTAQQQYFQGYQEVADQMAAAASAPVCHLYQPDFQLIDCDVNTCTVAGQYLAETEPNSGEILTALLRVTFIWKLIGSACQIIHIHISNPLEYQESDEALPRHIGSRTYEYVQQLLKKERKHRSTLTFYGRNAETFFLHPDEIYYAEALNINCAIHCSRKSLVACQPMARLVQILPQYFVRIHRSYIVNPHHIVEIRRCCVVMVNGDQLPIPEKKYSEIRKCLKAYSVMG